MRAGLAGTARLVVVTRARERRAPGSRPWPGTPRHGGGSTW